VRELVSRFRRQFDAGQVPPFSRHHAADDPPPWPCPRPLGQTHRP
jgi:hypothetical protein